MRGPTGRTALAVWLLCVVIGGCAPTATATPTPLPITLIRLPPDPVCETSAFNFGTLTFTILPGKPVTATTDAGKVLSIAWDKEFVGDSDENAIRDATGAIVVRDGEVVVLPETGSPRLHGHYLCIELEYIWVFGPDPT